MSMSAIRRARGILDKVRILTRYRVLRGFRPHIYFNLFIWCDARKKNIFLPTDAGLTNLKIWAKNAKRAVKVAPTFFYCPVYFLQSCINFIEKLERSFRGSAVSQISRDRFLQRVKISKRLVCSTVSSSWRSTSCKSDSSFSWIAVNDLLRLGSYNTCKHELVKERTSGLRASNVTGRRFPL